ncbi:ABC transporter ATP-binding protein [Acetobacter oeni]|uniref:Sugar ABC transporter ATP-binding protein n=1 Tax=Acetobacter oeni TaxID=304077 RepID=A0A511XHE5_9PROT|nr:ABC transporter ATP-binding protein [Acetobacter oeni]MBB3881215.1 lipopolysaccharide transport system ATP-binding protein [Acetobacter oeni]NHO18091.1 ATP-binding cassette domain-containing protein [Acetobacter oeni]GBR08333.1 O-antigen exporter ATP-binding protein [Acetobacter oeni LMG 21952]GEN62367.1 sugar ABC transporter ATP-binding protein [Acetobacter oeni]
MASVDVSGLTISFPLYHGDARSLKKTLGGALNRRALSGRFAQDNRQRVMVQALTDVSFSLCPGERLGLVGRNGAGKTTLLRALAGIYEPVKGRVLLRGRIGSLLDTSLGMNPELSGRENIRLRCLFSGLSEKAIAEVEQDVESFAGLGSFMDLPLKTYSSGMAVRLAFGLATAIMPQILIMDEWFMAGDASFIQRAEQRIAGLVEGAEILIVSSHMPEIISQWCTRLIWMEQGRVVMDGPTEEILHAYLSAEQ